MLSTIVVNEIMDHMKSLRLVLTFVLLIVLMALSATLYIPDYNRQVEDFSRNRSETMSKFSDLATQQAGLFFVYSFNFQGPWVYRNPNHLSFISEGHSRDLPNAFQPSAFRIYGPSKRIRSNILLWKSEELDWALIIGLVMSFMAIVLVYDRISGDRENGTLRLLLSNSVSRSTVIFGKFLSGFICLSTALLLGIIIHLIILTAFGNVPLAPGDWGVAGMTFVLSLIYISVFLMAGLFISSVTRESATSLVVALLFWALVVIVIPRTGGLIASRITEIPTWGDAQEQARQGERDTRNDYDAQYPSLAKAGMSGHWSPGEPLERAILMSDAWNDVIDDYRNQMMRQVELARAVTLVSPYACFTGCLEKLAESGIEQYRRFFEQVRDYKSSMRQSLLDAYPLPVTWHRWDANLQTEKNMALYKQLLDPLDSESVPVFQEKRTDTVRLVNAAMPQILLLVLFNALFFAGAFMGFIRYDVR